MPTLTIAQIGDFWHVHINGRPHNIGYSRMEAARRHLLMIMDGWI